MSGFRYTHAIVCRIPRSAASNVKDKKIDVEKMKQEFETLVGALRKLGVDVIELPADEDSPQCYQLDDLSVVINGTALLTRPGCKERRREVSGMKCILQKELGKLHLLDIKDDAAVLDGGDVLFTGQEIFVGVHPSGGSNVEGARAVAQAFPEYPTSPITVSGGERLKGIVSMAGPGLMTVCNTLDARDTLKRIEREATFRYQVLMIPDPTATSTLYVNGTLIHRSDALLSNSLFREKIDFPRYPVDMLEYGKLGGAASLSSIPILIHLPRHIKKI